MENNENLELCRNCKSEVTPKIKRCPYCGVLNPTVKIKEIVITTLIMIVLIYGYGFLFMR